MDISKTEPEKNDVKSKSKIPPPMPTMSSRISGCKNSETVQSKIPKRDVCPAKDSSLSDLKLKTTKAIRQVGGNKSSASMMNLKLPKTTSLASTRSCFNSHRSVKSKEQTPRLENSDKISELKKKAERAASKRNLQSFETAKEKLENCQEQFMSKFNLVKEELAKDDRDYKLVCLIKNNECQLVSKNQPSRVVKMGDGKTLEELKASLKDFPQKILEAIDSLDELAKSPREIGDTAFKSDELFKQIQETKRKLLIEMKTDLKGVLHEIESLQAANDKSKESTSAKDFEAKLNEFNELNTRLKESQAEVTKIKKNSEQKLSTFKKELEERNKTDTKKQTEIDELKKKNEFLEKESLKAKSLSKEVSEKLHKKTHEWEDLNQKLKTCAGNNISLEAKNKEIGAKNKDLELTIDKMKLELSAAVNSEKDLIRDLTLKHTGEIKSVKNELSSIEKEKEFFEKEIQCLKNDIAKARKLESKAVDLQDEVNQANIEKLNLKETIRDLMERLETSQNDASVSRDVQEELTKLQRINNLNNEKIKNLDNELIRSQFQIKKLEEKIVLDEKLLKVRTDLIDSLQSKEKSQKIRLKDLFVEVGEKNNDLQMIRTEFLTKTEEFQKLFSTLSTNQMEVTRQEHVIKLLQENNERAQQLRVRQEAKIAKLEEEISDLKHTVSIYQDVVLPNNTLRRNLGIAEAYHGNCNDNLGFFVEERRKKRHIDISVKKYEK